MFDGPDMNSNSMGKFCGHGLPGNNGTIISNHNAVFLRFVSDSSVAHNGFHLVWNATAPVCGENIFGQTHGTVQSPGHPGNYPSNRNCSWTITVNYGKRIQFHFVSMRIESHPNCSFDYVEVIKCEVNTALNILCPHIHMWFKQIITYSIFTMLRAIISCTPIRHKGSISYNELFITMYLRDYKREYK